MNKGRMASLATFAMLVVSIAAFPPLASATTGTLTITTNTTLTEDHTGSIVIAADGVTLDCAGFSVIGPGFIGISLRGRTGVDVKDCAVTNFLIGFLVISSTGNTLTRNTAEGNFAIGIFLDASSGNTLTRNTANGGGNAGFLLDHSSGNTFTENTASGNGFNGLFLAASESNTFTGNTASGNGVGFFLVSRSSDNTLTGNTAEDNVDGFRVRFDSVGNEIIGNVIIRNDHGIHICRSLVPPQNMMAPNQFMGPQQAVFLDRYC